MSGTARLSNLLDSSATMSAGLSYFEYERLTGKRLVLPWLHQHIDLQSLTAVGDFGCHEGGVLQAFREETAIRRGFGVDLDANSIANSALVQDTQFFLRAGNILDLDPSQLAAINGPFDLILIRDVLEHIARPEAVLSVAYRCLRPGGWMFVSFPPYYSPFGGHQQETANWVKLVPYCHYLPQRLYLSLIRTADNTYMRAEDAMADITSVLQTRLSLGKAEKAFERSGFAIAARDLFLLRPEFKIRYGIPSCRNRLFGWMPGLREVTTMGAYYLLQRPGL